LADGFTIGQLAGLVIDGFATGSVARVALDGREKPVVWMKITEAGQQAIAALLNEKAPHEAGPVVLGN